MDKVLSIFKIVFAKDVTQTEYTGFLPIYRFYWARLADGEDHPVFNSLAIIWKDNYQAQIAVSREGSTVSWYTWSKRPFGM